MPKHRTLTLSQQQRQELTQQRDHAKEAYLRERCAAVLKVADGAKASHVAGFLRALATQARHHLRLA